MSAYIVSKPHIDLLVQAALAGPSDGKWARDPFSYYHGARRHQIEIGAEANSSSLRAELVSLDMLGQRLVDECVCSVKYRYGTGDLPGPCDEYYLEPYTFEPFRRSGQRICVVGMPEAICAPARIADIAAAINCYEYQACECPEWRESEMYAFCISLKDALLRSLPGDRALDLDRRITV